MRIEPRETVSWLQGRTRAGFGDRCSTLSLLGAHSLGGWRPCPKAYVLLLKGAFGSAFALNETLTRSIPLIFTGLAAAVAFRAKFYNIGGEGTALCRRTRRDLFRHRHDHLAARSDDPVSS